MSDIKNSACEAEVVGLFEKTGALLDGHFILRSGLRSRRFFQCALLLQYASVADRVCGLLADIVRPLENIESVISPAVGGIVVGQEVARHLDKRHIFAEKNDQGGLVLRRGFEIRKGERFVVAEDVVTRGGRVQETIDIVREHGGIVVAAASIVDRSGGKLPDFGCPFYSLVKLNIETFDPENLPPDLKNIPAIKPGSK
ncbi:MAG: orotate phosphoribosyltransferase [Chthoniobacterales bacterium]